MAATGRCGSARGRFGAAISRWLLAAGLGGGGAISLLAAVLAWLLITGRSRAVALAERMTRDLRATEADFRRERRIMDTFMRSVPDAVYFKDLQSRFIKCSHSMARFWQGQPRRADGQNGLRFLSGGTRPAGL